MKICTLLVMLGISATAATTSVADEVKGNAATGATKVTVCQACHGEGGKTPAATIYPKLAGQSNEYLQSAMISYRDGLRQGGMSAMMAPQVATLSDQDIGDIAAYYSQQSPAPQAGKAKKSPAKP